jgi:plastocyanin
MKNALLLAAALAAAPAIAYAGAAAPLAANTTVVAIRNMHFTPDTLTIAAGTTVTWINKDEMPHTVTAKGGAFRSAALDTDERFSHIFAAPGDFIYFCTIHPLMVGRIVVTAAGKSS